MPRLLLLIAIAAVIYILYRQILNLPPHKRRAAYLKLGLAVAVVVVVVLTIMGKMHWLGAAFTGLLVAARQLLPTLIRVFPMLSSLRGQTRASAGQHSTVATDILRMDLAHDSGALTGEVLKGEFTGWHLADLDRDQLDQLFAYCQAQDQDSVQLLDSYLQQRFPNDQHSHRNSANNATPSAINSREALSVLGLEEGASKEEIIDAHRKLIQKLHPDRGGNDYLAAKVNQAKDHLLG